MPHHRTKQSINKYWVTESVWLNLQCIPQSGRKERRKNNVNQPHSNNIHQLYNTMSDIRTVNCNCSLSSFTWNNYFFYSPTDILSQNNLGIWSVKWNFPGQEHWNCSDVKWQDKGKIVVWALNTARYLNRNYTQISGLIFEHLWHFF
jgi:hypothetical protein